MKKEDFKYLINEIEDVKSKCDFLININDIFDYASSGQISFYLEHAEYLMEFEPECPDYDEWFSLDKPEEFDGIIKITPSAMKQNEYASVTPSIVSLTYESPRTNLISNGGGSKYYGFFQNIQIKDIEFCLTEKKFSLDKILIYKTEFDHLISTINKNGIGATVPQYKEGNALSKNNKIARQVRTDKSIPLFKKIDELYKKGSWENNYQAAETLKEKVFAYSKELGLNRSEANMKSAIYKYLQKY